MAGFNSPNILFLNTYDALDRKYAKELVPKLLSAGYERYTELYCGAFVMPLIVAADGVKPEDMYCYDVSLFSNVLGYTFSGRDLNELEVKKNGELIVLDREDAVENAALLLYEQALARLKKAEHIQYFYYLVRDMQEQKEYHIKKIAEKIRKMDSVLHGLHFETLYIWDAYEKAKDDEKMFILSNPPTYKGAYEKFFDTDGVITWKYSDLDYEIWDGSVHCKQLLQKSLDQNALLLFLQQADKGKAASDEPVSARFLSVNQNVYWNTNKPTLVKELLGLKEETARGAVRKKSKFKILPSDHPITEKSKIKIFVEEQQVAEYYRRLWLHRITGKSVSVHLCVLIDGMIAGFIGLDYNAIIKPYRETDKNTIILSYAVPAPNKTCRLARLLVEIAKSKKIVIDALSEKKQTQMVLYTSVADSICTVEYTKYPEIKGLRGLMKIWRKDKQSESLYALHYGADLTDCDDQQALANFANAERKYQDGKRAE